MRRVCVALGLSLTLSLPAFAQPDDPKAVPPKADSPFDLIRKLRENGLLDLATRRLNDLKANPALLPPDQAPVVLFEVALNKLEEASRESEDARRGAHILQAREAFAEFIRLNPKHPKVAQANVEIARLFALEAKSQLYRANRVEGEQAKADACSLARPVFDTAIARYKQAIVALDARIKAVPEGDPLAAELTQGKHQAELDTAVLEYEKARTYIAEGEKVQRGDAFVRAKKGFSLLADRYPGTRVGYLAEVWAQQSDYENGDPRAALAIEKIVAANRTNKDAADGLRLAAFFGIDHVFKADAGKDGGPTAQFQRTERAAEAWLRAYPAYRNTPEGLGATYYRALMKEKQAIPSGLTFAAPPKAKAPAKGKEEKEPEKAAPLKIIGISGTAKQLLEDANRVYKDLLETDNEYSERAHRRRLINQLIILEGEGRGNDPLLRSINTLEQGVIAAQVQQARMLTPQGPDGRPLEAEAAEKEVARRTRLAIDYLERALQRATPRDAPRDVFDAQMLLVLFLTKSDRATEAAVRGEALARTNPRSPKAATAAQLAVYAYNTALAKLKEARAPEADQEADVNRIRALGAFAVATWPADGPTDAIRHVLAFYQSKGNDPDGAWTTYSQITPSYPGAAQARLEMGAVMFNLVQPATDAERKQYRDVVRTNIQKRAAQWQATVRALEAVPEPLETATADAEAWARAKTQLAQLYLLGGDFARVDAVIKGVVERIKTFKNLAPGKRDDLAFGARALRYTSLQARAADAIKDKEFAKVGDLLDADLAVLKTELAAAEAKDGTTPPPNLDRMRRAQQGVLIAAMSAFVQDKKADKANELLGLLEKTGGGLDSSVEVMKRLAASIRGQIDELARAGNKADADGLRRSFGEFLDRIKGDDPAKLTTGVITFLGQGYGAVDQHARAAELYQALLNKPFANPGKTPEEVAAAEDADKKFRRKLQFEQARSYRLAADKDGFEKATALMKTIVGNPLDPNPKAARGWGYANIGVRKEYIALLEDQKLFNPAVQNWLKMIRDFVPGGIPAPVLFVAQRPTFEAAATAFDEVLAGQFGMPGRVRAVIDEGFKSVYPAAASKRKGQRDLYFDLYYEAQRCSARAYASADPAKFKGGPDAINTGLANVAQRLYDVVAKNDDVPAETVTEITALVDKHPAIKKRYDELKAAGPKP